MLSTGFFNLLLDTLIVVLLCVTIAYCWMLNRRIKVLQDSRGELALLLKHFDDSTRRASESVVSLQATSKRIGENIQVKIEKSNYLIEDLAYMIDKAEKIASRLEASFAVSRARGKAMAETTIPPSVPKPVPAVHHHRDAVAKEEMVRKTLASAMKESATVAPSSAEEGGVDRASKVMSMRSDTKEARKKKLSALEAMLEKVTARAKLPTMEDDEEEEERGLLRAGGKNAANSRANDMKGTPRNIASSSGGRQRSRAEQELLDMLKSGIEG